MIDANGNYFFIGPDHRSVPVAERKPHLCMHFGNWRCYFGNWACEAGTPQEAWGIFTMWTRSSSGDPAHPLQLIEMAERAHTPDASRRFTWDTYGAGDEP